MRTRLKAKFAAVLFSGGMLLQAGSCVPDNYWSGLVGDTITTVVVGAVADLVGDQVDAVDPALDVNTIE